MAEPDRRRSHPEVAALSGTETAWEKSPLQLQRERARARRARRSLLWASVSSVIVIVLLVWIVVSSPGWDRVQETFFSWYHAKQSFPDIARAFWVNIKLFLIAEPLILIAGLLIALLRGTTSAVLFPLRALAVIYTDLLRGVPTLLLVFLIAYGVPALRLQGVTNNVFWLGLMALTLSYSAYVAEVIRAGIESVHPSQSAAARSLGLSQGQTTRTVVLPQALRRVAPPLLNDFVSLQKDTALVAATGYVEALRETQVYASFNFNYTPYLVTGALFVALTIPLARLTDYLGNRALRRQHSAGPA